MIPEAAGSEFRVQKVRTDAVLTLSNGDSVHGHFFVADASDRHTGPECVGDLLNGETGFFPFERQEGGTGRTVLYNRRQVVIVALPDNEARREPGYAVAKERFVSVLLSNGHRLSGSVRVHRPRGRDRLSDWARDPEAFRYLEAGHTTFLVNIAHVTEVSEVPEP